MTVSAHNPDQYMASLRQIIAQGRKRIGLLVGAGAPAGIFPPGSDKPLIPAVAGLTDMVMEALKAEYGKTLDAVRAELETPNIETILSRVRSLAGVIGKTKVHDLDGEGYKKLSEAICGQIGIIVNKPLYDGPSPYTEFVTWISGTGASQSYLRKLHLQGRRSIALGSSARSGGAHRGAGGKPWRIPCDDHDRTTGIRKGDASESLRWAR